MYTLARISLYPWGSPADVYLRSSNAAVCSHKCPLDETEQLSVLDNSVFRRTALPVLYGWRQAIGDEDFNFPDEDGMRVGLHSESGNPFCAQVSAAFNVGFAELLHEK
jgi:hypothetical protein